MGTTGHGLVYVDSNDPPQAWVDSQNLAESVEAALDAYETWNEWTPIFNPGPTNWGSGGGVEGHYMQIGKLVHAEFRGQLGTGFVYGAGTTVLALPVPAFEFTVGNQLQAAVGSWIVRDESATRHYSGSIGIFGVSATSVSFAGAWDSTTPTFLRINETLPLTWQVDDIISGVLDYRAA